MDIQKLEKLSQLKQQGILSETEYEAQKKQILNEADTSSETEHTYQSVEVEPINWSHLGMAFFYTVLLYGLAYVLSSIFMLKDDILMKLIPISIIGICTFKLKTGQYQNTADAIFSMIAIYFLGPLIAWRIFYDMLQIKDEFRYLKTDNIKQKINTGLNIFTVLFVVLGLLFVVMSIL